MVTWFILGKMPNKTWVKFLFYTLHVNIEHEPSITDKNMVIIVDNHTRYDYHAQ